MKIVQIIALNSYLYLQLIPLSSQGPINWSLIAFILLAVTSDV